MMDLVRVDENFVKCPHPMYHLQTRHDAAAAAAPDDDFDYDYDYDQDQDYDYALSLLFSHQVLETVGSCNRKGQEKCPTLEIYERKYKR